MTGFMYTEGFSRLGSVVIPYMLFLRNDSNLVLKRIYLLSSLLFHG